MSIFNKRVTMEDINTTIQWLSKQVGRKLSFKKIKKEFLKDKKKYDLKDDFISWWCSQSLYTIARIG